MLVILNIEDFHKAYSIMEESFPVDERRPYEKQRELLDNKIYKLFGVWCEYSGDLKGLMAVYELENMVFLEHFAVSSRYRNSGLGANMLQELIESCGKMVCLEVELPTTEMTRRRIGFYERNGLCYNDYDYVQPALAKGQKPVELRIMSSGKKLSYEEFVGVRELIYKEVYHASKINSCL